MTSARSCWGGRYKAEAAKAPLNSPTQLRVAPERDKLGLATRLLVAVMLVF